MKFEMKEHNLNITEFDLVEIESIELIGVNQLVDITVDGTHMFFANGIYTHNSGASSDVVEAHHIADSYRKVMTADVVISQSRKKEDKERGTARFHMMKNRFGADGMTFPAKMNTSNGDIQLFDPSSAEGMNLQDLMDTSNEESENDTKTAMFKKFKEMKVKNKDGYSD